MLRAKPRCTLIGTLSFLLLGCDVPTAPSLAAHSVAGTAFALSSDTRSFTFSGTISGGAGSPFGQVFSAGDVVTGTLTYDASVVTVPGPTLAFYGQTVTNGITAIVGGRTYTSNNFVLIVENDGINGDGYNATSDFGGDLFENGLPVAGAISIPGRDFSGTALSSLSLLDFDPTLFNGSLALPQRNEFQLVEDNSNFLRATIDLVAANPTPEEMLMELAEQIEAVLESEGLTDNQATGLLDKIAGVLAKLDDGKLGPACNQLTAFIHQVAGFINNGQLTAIAGAPLIDAAESLRTAIGC